MLFCSMCYLSWISLGSWAIRSYQKKGYHEYGIVFARRLGKVAKKTGSAFAHRGNQGRAKSAQKSSGIQGKSTIAKPNGLERATLFFSGAKACSALRAREFFGKLCLIWGMLANEINADRR